MDPLTQGTLGASLSQASATREQVAGATLLGFFAGMAADLDVLIRSPSDPLLFLEYHRQFTHALIFIPIGGLLCALALHAVFGRRRGFSFRQSWLYCTLGYATHALLDSCTTYGTMLFWPFSDVRIAWNTISIIDPLFTLPLLTGVLFGYFKRQPRYAQWAFVWGLGYMALGVWQRNEAAAVGWELAAERGHEPLRLEAKPSFANILVWKVVYETPEELFVDAVRTGISPKVYPGESVLKLDLDRDMPWLDRSSQQARDIERFAWFSNGYIARDPVFPHRVIDVRYSLLPNEVAPLWSIELSPEAGPEEHVAYQTHRDPNTNAVGQLWAMLSGR